MMMGMGSGCIIRVPRWTSSGIAEARQPWTCCCSCWPIALEDIEEVRYSAEKVDKAALAAAGVDADTPDMTPWSMPRDRPEPRSRRFSNSPLEIEFTAKQELLEVLRTLQGDVIQHPSFFKWPVWGTFATH